MLFILSDPKPQTATIAGNNLWGIFGGIFLELLNQSHIYRPFMNSVGGPAKPQAFIHFPTIKYRNDGDEKRTTSKQMGMRHQPTHTPDRRTR